MEFETYVEGTQDPKDHKVSVNLTVSSNDYEMLREKLPLKMFDELETKRELTIMHEVMKSPGQTMLDKVDNTVYAWEREKQTTVRGATRYKLKYRY